MYTYGRQWETQTHWRESILKEGAVVGPQRDECQSDKSKFLNKHGYGTTMQSGAFLESNLS